MSHARAGLTREAEAQTAPAPRKGVPKGRGRWDDVRLEGACRPRGRACGLFRRCAGDMRGAEVREQPFEPLALCPPPDGGEGGKTRTPAQRAQLGGAMGPSGGPHGPDRSRGPASATRARAWRTRAERARARPAQTEARLRGAALICHESDRTEPDTSGPWVTELRTEPTHPPIRV